MAGASSVSVKPRLCAWLHFVFTINLSGTILPIFFCKKKKKWSERLRLCLGHTARK